MQGVCEQQPLFTLWSATSSSPSYLPAIVYSVHVWCAERRLVGFWDCELNFELLLLTLILIIDINHISMVCYQQSHPILVLSHQRVKDDHHFISVESR